MFCCSIMAANYFLLFLMIYRPFLLPFSVGTHSSATPICVCLETNQAVCGTAADEQSLAVLECPADIDELIWLPKTECFFAKVHSKSPTKSCPFVRKVTRLLYILGTIAEIGNFAVHRPRSQLRTLLHARTSCPRARLQLQQCRHHHHHNFNDDGNHDRDSDNDQQQIKRRVA